MQVLYLGIITEYILYNVYNICAEYIILNGIILFPPFL